MQRGAAALLFGFLSLVLLALFGWGVHLTTAADEPADRQTEIVVPFTQYEWWLTRWSDNVAVCSVYTDHDGLPTPNEVLEYCGQTLYNQWSVTAPCSGSETAASACKGLYLHAIASAPQQRTVYVDLPEPQVFISMIGCGQTALQNRCQQAPTLILSAREPLPNEFITAIHGALDGDTFSCPGDLCEIPLRATSTQGVRIEFWADSSFGDSSPHYTAQVRVVDTGVTDDPAQAGWYVDILSSQWLGGDPASSCAQSWGAFPPLGEGPAWLANPEQPEGLVSSEPYAYLAGRLIATGVVDAASCPAGGLLENGWANPCGVETARETVNAWQNRFDADILAAAQAARLPAQLLKNLFAWESQFWPGAYTEANIQEFGLGRITEQGADTILLWNPEFYAQFCPLVLDSGVCELGYAWIEKEDQAMLRGALVMSVNADCADCTAGIDLTYAGYSIDLFAQTLQANCEQTGQIVRTTTQLTPGAVATYADLWRLTLANYHAGPGCLSNAVQETWNANRPLTWSNVAQRLDPGCSTAIGFVENIAGAEDPADVLPAPTRPPSAATAAPAPTPTVTPYPTPEE